MHFFFDTQALSDYVILVIYFVIFFGLVADLLSPFDAFSKKENSCAIIA